jgi:hypothetical protein
MLIFVLKIVLWWMVASTATMIYVLNSKRFNYDIDLLKSPIGEDEKLKHIRSRFLSWCIVLALMFPLLPIYKSMANAGSKG